MYHLRKIGITLCIFTLNAVIALESSRSIKADNAVFYAFNRNATTVDLSPYVSGGGPAKTYRVTSAVNATNVINWGGSPQFYFTFTDPTQPGLFKYKVQSLGEDGFYESNEATVIIYPGGERG